jgi:hypothetical protein
VLKEKHAEGAFHKIDYPVAFIVPGLQTANPYQHRDGDKQAGAKTYQDV